MDRAVVLARGIGSRMRRESPAVVLDAGQTAAAEVGVKAMIPFGRPFLDYVLSVVADAGYRRVCLVVGPEHFQVREHYSSIRMRRLQVEFATQPRPLGTADAVTAAEVFAAGEPFLVINSDNYYPLTALTAMREVGGSAVAAFDCETLVSESNLTRERVAKFAPIEADAQGNLRRIIEKPDPSLLADWSPQLGVGMNCWRFGPSIFPACRAIGPSPRGEYEITDAVQYAIDQLGERFQVIRCQAPVLDLSQRGDIGPVASRLASVEVAL